MVKFKQRSKGPEIFSHMCVLCQCGSGSVGASGSLLLARQQHVRATWQAELGVLKVLTGGQCC